MDEFGVGRPAVREALLESLKDEVDAVSTTLMRLRLAKDADQKRLADLAERRARLRRILWREGFRELPPAEAEKVTGYHVGGISPFGQKKRVPTAFEEAALAHDTVYMNGGQRGLQVHLKPADAVKALDAKAVPLVAD